MPNFKNGWAGDDERTIEIITNSVLTSDNFLAQSVFDQEVAKELTKNQRIYDNDGLIDEFHGFGEQIMSQADFDKIIADGRIKIWELGRLDAVEFGGEEIYGKLHGKFLTIDDETFFYLYL